jgi:hypothetical protein
VQAPLVQPSANVGLHARHEPPFGPQLLAVGGATQVLPLQQPLGQLVELHTQFPLTHAWPAPHTAPAPHLQVPFAAQVSPPSEGQFAHDAPFSPQLVALGGVTQELPLQQPEVQLVELH